MNDLNALDLEQAVKIIIRICKINGNRGERLKMTSKRYKKLPKKTIELTSRKY